MTQKSGEVEIVALVFIDPGGSVPKWIVNWFAGPYGAQHAAGPAQAGGDNISTHRAGARDAASGARIPARIVFGGYRIDG
jgi:hypothetical protein